MLSAELSLVIVSLKHFYISMKLLHTNTWQRRLLKWASYNERERVSCFIWRLSNDEAVFTQRNITFRQKSTQSCPLIGRERVQGEMLSSDWLMSRWPDSSEAEFRLVNSVVEPCCKNIDYCVNKTEMRVLLLMLLWCEWQMRQEHVNMTLYNSRGNKNITNLTFFTTTNSHNGLKKSFSLA